MADGCRIVTLAGGYANAAAQDSFCAGTTCMITAIYDQTPGHNDLTIEGPGGNGGQDVGRDRRRAAGHRRRPQGLRHVRSPPASATATTHHRRRHRQPARGRCTWSPAGTHVNGRCCFDYGNAETNNMDTGNGHMDAIYFGTLCWFSPCNGAGPWVQADLENGLFQSDAGGSKNTRTPATGNAVRDRLLKNNGTTIFAIKDGNAQSRRPRRPRVQPAALPDHRQSGLLADAQGRRDHPRHRRRQQQRLRRVLLRGRHDLAATRDAAENAVQANVVMAGIGRLGPPVPRSACPSTS